MNSRDIRRQVVALRGLGRLGTRAAPAADQALALLDPEDNLVSMAALPIAGLKGPTAAADVLSLVDPESEWDLDQLVASTLSAMGPGVIPFLREELSNPSEGARRYAAIAALAGIEGPGIATLIDLIRDHEDLREAAAEVLADCGPALVPVVLGLVQRSPERIPEVLPLLGATWLEDESPRVLKFIGGLYDAQPAHRAVTLRTAMECSLLSSSVFFDDWTSSRVEILHTMDPVALHDMHVLHAEALEGVALTLLRRGLTDPNVEVRRVAAEHLVGLPEDLAPAAALSAVADEDVQVRRLALAWLAEAGPVEPAAVAVFRKHLDADDAETAGAAMVGLARAGS